MPQSPTLADVLSQALENHQGDVWTALPARVESYDATTQTITAQPLIYQSFLDERGERRTERMPVIGDVPVMFPGSGACSITFPVEKGAVVLLVFASASLDVWLARGGEVDPEDDRRNDISDAIAIPGLRPRPGAIKSPSRDGITIATSTLIRLGDNTSDDPIALKSDLEAFASGIDARIADLTPGLPGTATEINTLTAIKSALPPGWPVCSSIVRAK